jgi:hypothetical protein
MKLSLVNLTPLKEGAFGMSAKDLAATYSLKKLQSIRDEIMGDMEQEAEPEGGRIADMYADQLQGIDDAIALKQPKKDVPYDVAIGKMTQGEYDKHMSTVAPNKDAFTKSSKFDRMNESTEKSWNAIDVSRKAEKEIGNKEWNERTGKKLDMLKALNSAGKFKKDFDDERLQGWVDQNYSWEKLSRQFKINEAYDKMFDFEPEDMDNPDEDLVIIGSGYLDIKSKFGERPSQTNGEYAEIGQKVVDQLHNGDKEAALDFIYSKINEGSCGYGPDGVPGDTPGGTKGMDADNRTKDMVRKLIQKEIAKLNEGDPEAIKGKHYPDEDTVKKLKKGPYTPGGQNAQKEGSFDKGLEDLMGKDDFEKATSNEVPGLGDTVIDDKTDISTGKKTFMQMMTQFTDEPFLIETGLKLYDAWARGEGGLKPSRILKILQDTSN